MANPPGTHAKHFKQPDDPHKIVRDINDMIAHLGKKYAELEKLDSFSNNSQQDIYQLKIDLVTLSEQLTVKLSILDKTAQEKRMAILSIVRNDLAAAKTLLTHAQETLNSQRLNKKQSR